MYDLAESLVSCLDRASARRLVRRRPEDPTLLKRIRELEATAALRLLTEDERTELTMYISCLKFVGVLQLKARALLRRPAGLQPSSGKRRG